MEFDEEELEVIKNLIKDFGFEYRLVSDPVKVGKLAEKLSMDEHYWTLYE